MANYCKICRAEIHPKRVELGYKDTCPTHSTASKYTGHLVVEGSANFSIQVIRDEQVAKELSKLSHSHLTN
jgi:acetate kinase